MNINELNLRIMLSSFYEHFRFLYILEIFLYKHVSFFFRVLNNFKFSLKYFNMHHVIKLTIENGINANYEFDN